MTHWTDAGFGTDPAGDADRRAELDSRRVDPDRLAILGGYGLPAAREQQPAPVEPAPGTDQLGEQVEGHAVAVMPSTMLGVDGVGFACECGRWEAVVTGRSSSSWAGRDYRRHVREETADRGE